MRRRGAAETVWLWLEARPVRALACFLGLTVLLRVWFLNFPLESDEGGFLMVAAQWHGKGSALYTDQWVDRPPLLLLVFKLADILGGHPVVVRLLAIAFALMTTTAAWWAGRVINGRRGAVAAGLVAASVGSMFAIDGYALTGECIAGAFVMTSCALILHAKYAKVTPRIGIVLALGAGVAASAAFLTKQNFVDAALFAFALLVFKPHKTWRMMIAYAVGVAIPVLITGAWAVSNQGPGLYKLWVALFRFRQRSLNVIEDATLAAPLERLKWLGVLFIVTGLFLLAWQLLLAARRVDGRHSLRIALVAMLVYDVVSILVGASWWSHYLLQLTAVLSMGAALATKRKAPRRQTHYAPVIVMTTAVISTVIGIAMGISGNPKGGHDEIVGDFLRTASDPGDSVVLAYGAPSVIEVAGLSTPYRYSWSLPLRTRDPKLKDFVSVLRGPDAPTWLVEIGDFDWWGLDTPDFDAVRADRYHVVATVCGHDIYLRNDLHRSLPSEPAC
jgi:4-amino-4-deoxy-L-arabinose transferase-like glycosyltransferase